MTNLHLKTGVDSTPEKLCLKHFRQWILSNKFMLQIKHHCHKPFELHCSCLLLCPGFKQSTLLIHF